MLTTLSVTGSALLRTICERPDDDCARLVFADWLEENGEGEHAEFIRLQIELAKSVACEWEKTDGAACPQYNAKRPPYRVLVHCPTCARIDRLHSREKELLAAHGGLWAQSLWAHNPSWAPDSWTFRRGFVAEVRTTAALWLAHGGAICGAQPVERVRLSDWELLRPNNVPDPWPAWLGEFTPRLPSGMLTYEQDALDMLSAACIALARSRAGLPPLRA